MAVTTPDNIVTPDDGDDYALVQDLGAMADSVQEAITDWKNYGIGTDADRLALTGSSNPPLKDGLRWYSTDTGVVYLYAGSTWVPVGSEEQSFTPVFTGITLGNGTRGGSYWYVGADLVFFRAWVKFGSTSAVTGSVSLDLPVTADLSASGGHDAGLDAKVIRPGIFFGPLFAPISSAPKADIYAGGSGGAYVGYTALSSSIPGTWGTDAVLSVAGTYKRA